MLASLLRSSSASTCARSLSHHRRVQESTGRRSLTPTSSHTQSLSSSTHPRTSNPLQILEGHCFLHFKSSPPALELSAFRFTVLTWSLKSDLVLSSPVSLNVTECTRRPALLCVRDPRRSYPRMSVPNPLAPSRHPVFVAASHLLSTSVLVIMVLFPSHHYLYLVTPFPQMCRSVYVPIPKFHPPCSFAFRHPR